MLLNLDIYYTIKNINKCVIKNIRDERHSWTMCEYWVEAMDSIRLGDKLRKKKKILLKTFKHD